MLQRRLIRRSLIIGQSASAAPTATFDIEYFVEREVEGVGAYYENVGWQGWAGFGGTFDLEYNTGGGAAEGSIITGITLVGDEETSEQIQTALDAGTLTPGWVVTCTSCDIGTDTFTISVQAPVESGTTYDGYEAVFTGLSATSSAVLSNGVNGVSALASIFVKNGGSTVETLFDNKIFVSDADNSGNLSHLDLPPIQAYLSANILAGRTIVVNSLTFDSGTRANVTVTWPLSLAAAYNGYTIEDDGGSVIEIDPVGVIGV